MTKKEILKFLHTMEAYHAEQSKIYWEEYVKLLNKQKCESSSAVSVYSTFEYMTKWQDAFEKINDFIENGHGYCWEDILANYKKEK